MPGCVHVRTYNYMCAHTRVHMYVHIGMYVCTYVHRYVRMYVCMSSFSGCKYYLHVIIYIFSDPSFPLVN